MQIDVTVVIQRLDDEKPYLTAPPKMVMGNGEIVENPDSKPLTLRLALLSALDAEPKQEKLPLVKQMGRYHLAKRIKKNDIVELSSGNITTLKRVVAARYNPLLTGAIAELLEPGVEGTESSEAEE